MSAQEWLDKIEGDLFRTQRLNNPTAKQMMGMMYVSALLNHRKEAEQEGFMDKWRALYNVVVDEYFGGTDPRPLDSN